MAGACIEERKPRCHLFCVTLPAEAEAAFLPIPANLEFLEVDDFCDKASTKNGADLLGPGCVPLGRINQLPAGSVGELHLRSRTVGKWKTTARRPDRLRGHAYRARVKQKTEIVKEVTGLAEHAPTALGVICVPMLRVKLAGRHAKARRFRPRRLLEKLLKFNARTGKSPVESNHD